MSKEIIVQEESVFANLNLSNDRAEGESRDDWRMRQRMNEKVLRLYKQLGRPRFKVAFPEGVQPLPQVNQG